MRHLLQLLCGWHIRDLDRSVYLTPHTFPNPQNTWDYKHCRITCRLFTVTVILIHKWKTSIFKRDLNITQCLLPRTNRRLTGALSSEAEGCNRTSVWSRGIWRSLDICMERCYRRLDRLASPPNSFLHRGNHKHDDAPSCLLPIMHVVLIARVFVWFGSVWQY